jgi:hypothetical protein
MTEDLTRDQAREEFGELLGNAIEEHGLAEYPEQEFIHDEFIIGYKGYSFKIKIFNTEEDKVPEIVDEGKETDVEEGER